MSPSSPAIALAFALHGAQSAAKDYPGLLFDVRHDDKGDLDRESFFVKVSNGKPEVTQTLKPKW